MITLLVVSLIVVILLLVSAGLFVVWRYWLSIKVVGKDEVAIMLFFGEPKPLIHESGPIFVPWVPIRWDKHYPWELVRVPTKQLPFNFEGKAEQRIWSKDRQMLLVDISGYVRFPFAKPDSLVLMIKSGVPTEEAALQKWMEKEVVSGLRDIMAGFDHKEAIGRSNISAIRVAATGFFLQPAGLFVRSGLCGNDSHNFTVGTGEVIIRIDTVNPTAELQKAMESPVVVTYQAEAAKKTAEIEKTLAGDPIRLAMDEWVASQVVSPETLAQAKARLIANGAYAKHELIVKDIILARSGNLQVVRNELGSPDGTPLPNSLTYLSVGGGGGAGILIGGNPGGGGKNPVDAEKAAQEFFDKNGVWPSWDPKGRGPKKP